MWPPSKEEDYKPNIDVAEPEELKWGIGAIIQDHKGEVLAAKTWRIACGTEVLVTEGMGMQLDSN